MATVRRFADLEALSRAAAADFAALARESVDARGVFHVALSGGSTPKRLFQLLAADHRDLPWGETVLWFGDERTVPPEHADSNFRMARENLIVPLGLDEARVNRMRGEDDPVVAAADYAKLLSALGNPPVLDLALQGMGPDGHTASLFPGTAALSEEHAWVVANAVDSPVAHGKTVRITVTPPVLRAAQHVRVLVGGADKAAALHAVLEGPRDVAKYPSQCLTGADVVWFVDAAAAAALS
ncbi:MAG TPA: 6-phosphogluconolactonase [Kofleriaceae bacterium]